MNFVVAIPSYKRSDILQLQTLALCNRAGISPDSIYIFIVGEDNSERDSYAIFSQKGYHVVSGPLELHHMRNFIHQYFEENQRVLCMDDDISTIMEMREDLNVLEHKSAKRYPLYDVSNSLCDICNTLFAKLDEHGANLFGFYPVKNGYFMKSLPIITTDLRFCVGTIWGMKNKRSCLLSIEEKEDVERTLWYYTMDGVVLRHNRIAPVTKYYKTPGGMQAFNIDRKEAAKKSCNYLLQKYPDLCKLYTSKKSGVFEIRLKSL